MRKNKTKKTEEKKSLPEKEENNCNEDNLPTNGDINDKNVDNISYINYKLKKDSYEKIKT
ncbi:hypothetical protein PFDG_05009 [Plasmodium falciparum Dd2]|uniref:Uncharacterized protein n=1 Tax=Plasmodium falciparum (isolate Dd2) TaxID=57267 RepID=A0A0L7MA46_PLAF4|nr:hypothetical protein PFDG_05009 [Plasmodium falciparum Dd2]